MSRSTAFVLAFAFCGACKAFGPGAPGAGTSSQTVSIRLIGAIVSPSKTDGSYWDGVGRVPGWLTERLVRFANAGSDLAVLTDMPTVGEPLSQFENWLVQSALNAVTDYASEPDPYGRAELLVAGSVVGQVLLPKKDNTYTPRWYEGWTGVDWTSRPSVRITLVDSDDMRDDLIGSVEIATNDLETALADSQPKWIPVGNQSHGQLLYVGVLVTAEGWTYDEQQSRPTPPTDQQSRTPATDPSSTDEPSSVSENLANGSSEIAARCDQLINHAFDLTSVEQGHIPSETQRDAFRSSPQMEEARQKCNAQPPSASAFTCMMSSGSLATFSDCESL